MSPLIKDGDIVLYEEFKFPLFSDVTCLEMTSERCGGEIPSLSPPFRKGGNPPLISPFDKGGKRGILRPGDMVVYKINDEIYIHRIVSINNGRFIISNDDDIEKHIIEEDQILGRVVSRYNGFFGYLIHIFLRTMRKVFRKAKE